MSAYKLEQLLKLWARDQLTLEQVIGQILLHLQALTERVAALERRSGPPPGQPPPANDSPDNRR